jgi:hypothetical protein
MTAKTPVQVETLLRSRFPVVSVRIRVGFLASDACPDTCLDNAQPICDALNAILRLVRGDAARKYLLPLLLSSAGQVHQDTGDRPHLRPLMVIQGEPLLAAYPPNALSRRVSDPHDGFELRLRVFAGQDTAQSRPRHASFPRDHRMLFAGTV